MQDTMPRDLCKVHYLNIWKMFMQSIMIRSFLIINYSLLSFSFEIRWYLVVHSKNSKNIHVGSRMMGQVVML